MKDEQEEQKQNTGEESNYGGDSIMTTETVQKDKKS